MWCPFHGDFAPEMDRADPNATYDAWVWMARPKYWHYRQKRNVVAAGSERRSSTESTRQVVLLGSNDVGWMGGGGCHRSADSGRHRRRA